MVVAQLKEHGYVDRAWLGVQVQPVSADIADSLGLKTAEGAIVNEPQPGSPAAKAGIATGDVITAINGAPLKDCARSRPQNWGDGARHQRQAYAAAQKRAQDHGPGAWQNAE